MTRDEYIAEAAARYHAVVDRNGIFQARDTKAVTRAVTLADALEAAGCAPWAAKAKPKRAVAFGHGASWFVSIGTLGTPAFPSKESAAAFAAAINGEDAT